MKDTNHYIITANDSDIEIHIRNIPEEKATEAIKTGVQYFVHDPANGIFFGKVFNVSDTINLYRRMCEEEVTECLNKALEFQNKGVPETIQKTERIVQMAIDKKFYTSFRNELIPQLQSSQYSKSVYNYEGITLGRITSLETYKNIPDSVKRNVGIHKNDVSIVNEKIKSIEILDPIVKNGFLRYLSNNKLQIGMLALSITIDVTRIVLSVVEDDYRIGSSTIVTLCNLVGSKGGAAIGAAICSIIPGVGSIVGGILGSIIFSFVGTKIGQLFCGLFTEVACGPGPPEPDYLQFIYGDNKNFSIPLPKYELEMETGLPKTNYERTDKLVSEYDATNVYEPPKSVYDDPCIYGPPPSDY
ncbi:unnamed protein product [Rotaria sordida]|uniref:Uncharacterized protein n=1 Tax=Rotaria sordida TaxID=392033 RepID=A0A819UES0_9BILA|nr:unnamed protein product [Rotaria sordida]CAF4095832.1 unnamed protein product [Rotaria sordida]